MSKNTSSGARPKGRDVPFKLSRIWVSDLLHFAAKVPSIPVQRRMNLASVVSARAALTHRPNWAAILAKAYSVVATNTPVLRQSFLTFPRPRLFEYPESIAAIAVERPFEGEEAVFFGHVRAPDQQTLLALHEHVRRFKEAPLESIGEFRRMLSFSRLPQWLRRCAWWWGLNGSGDRRARRFGTFGVSMYGSLGAESLHPISPLTTLLNCGVIGADGTAQVRIVYDHRVMDGAIVARTLQRLEEVLNGALVAELRDLQQRQPLSPQAA